MAKVTALSMDTITKKSGHSMVPMAVSVCLTPAAPSPLPLPYPVTASISEGIVDPPMRTKFDGAIIGTVGSCFKACHGNEPGTLKEVVSLNTAGPCFLILGAPIVFVELGMCGITLSPGMMNKAITVGASGSASGAGGAGGGGGAGSDGSGNGPSTDSAQNQSNGGGSGGSNSNSGATMEPGDAHGNPEPSEEVRQKAAEPNVDGDDAGNAEREAARREVVQHYMDNHHRETAFLDDPPRAVLLGPPVPDRHYDQSVNSIDFSEPVTYRPPGETGLEGEPMPAQVGFAATEGSGYPTDRRNDMGPSTQDDVNDFNAQEP